MEKQIEQYLIRKVKSKNGKCHKFTAIGRRSVPDRLVLLPGGQVIFVECKDTGKTLSKLQEIEHEELKKLGFKVFTVDSKEKIDEMLRV